MRYVIIGMLAILACGDNIRPAKPPNVDCGNGACTFVDAAPCGPDASYPPSCGGDICLPDAYVPTPDAYVPDASPDAGTCKGDPQPDHGNEPDHAHDCTSSE